MDVFIKVSAGVLVALTLYLMLSQLRKEFSLLLTVATCGMIALVAFSFLEPIYSYIDELIALSQIDSEMVTIVLKATAVGLLAEIINLICVDAGNASLGKLLQIFAAVVILRMSLPLFSALISLAEEILVAI